MPGDAIGDELALWGKVLLLGTRGRRSGQPAITAVGFVEAADGSYLVSAGEETSDWALNLRRDPRCEVGLEGATRPFRAEELDGDDRSDVIVALILKYGTPAERLGRGPAFRLRPTEPSNGDLPAAHP
jgi:deazaflavin-dependent oxidoreductase (nitroreductase family)